MLRQLVAYVCEPLWVVEEASPGTMRRKLQRQRHLVCKLCLLTLHSPRFIQHTSNEASNVLQLANGWLQLAIAVLVEAVCPLIKRRLRFFQLADGTPQRVGGHDVGSNVLGDK